MSILIRMREIREELEELGKKEDLITSAEEKRFDELVEEFNELRRKEDLSDINKFMKAPISEPIKPNISGSDIEPEIKFYNRNNLEELRSYIRSQDKTGITEPVSAGKFIRGLITGDWSNAEVERRAITTTTSGGGWIVPEIISAIIIPMALNKSQVFKAGAMSVPMESKTLVVPKITAMPSTEWKGESVKFAEETLMTFSGITLEANTLMALVKLSIELAQDGINVQQVIENAISDAIALALDLAVLNGAGGLEPTGILNTEGILTEDLENAEITSYDFLSRAYFKLEAENEIATGLIAPSDMFADLDLLKDKNDNRLLPPISFEGTPQKPSYQKLSSNQLSTNAVLGDFGKVLVGMRTELQIDVADKVGDSFEKMEVWIRAFIRADVGIKRPKAFCEIANYGEVAS
ncbi:hypothetical protein ES702_02864 [subsurface metagenome]